MDEENDVLVSIPIYLHPFLTSRVILILFKYILYARNQIPKKFEDLQLNDTEKMKNTTSRLKEKKRQKMIEMINNLEIDIDRATIGHNINQVVFSFGSNLFKPIEVYIIDIENQYTERDFIENDINFKEPSKKNINTVSKMLIRAYLNSSVDVVSNINKTKVKVLIRSQKNLSIKGFSEKRNYSPNKSLSKRTSFCLMQIQGRSIKKESSETDTDEDEMDSESFYGEGEEENEEESEVIEEIKDKLCEEEDIDDFLMRLQQKINIKNQAENNNNNTNDNENDDETYYIYNDIFTGIK